MRINIKLFHGTSTLFKDSIIKNGLGGKNPLIKYAWTSFILNNLRLRSVNGML